MNLFKGLSDAIRTAEARGEARGYARGVAEAAKVAAGYAERLRKAVAEGRLPVSVESNTYEGVADSIAASIHSLASPAPREGELSEGER